MSGLLLPSDHDRIADLVRKGDPIVGWRGDETMDCYLNDSTGECEVWAFDASGQRYKAVVQSCFEPGWKHTLLRKLRDGDWQTDAVGRWLAEQEAAEEARAKAQYEAMEALAEKAGWAMRRDIGAHVGGLTREFY